MQIHRWRHIAGIAVLAGVASFLIFGYTTVYAALTSTQPLPARERFTELAFNNHLGLPHTATGLPQAIQFHITNHEGVPKDYSYTITATDPKGAVRLLKSGHVFIANGSQAIVNATYTLPPAAPLTDISVKLTDPAQEIHFWVGTTK